MGLLGLELLLGRPPVDVATFANLEIKKQFFESPRLFFGELSSKQPAFSFVLARMLERKPEKRWASMSDLVRALQEIEAGEVPEIVRERADGDYSDKLRDNRSFFHSFYQRFFESSDEIGKLFDRRGVKLDDQYRKLDRAMGSLLNFNRRLKTTSIDAQIESHGDFGLEAKHFEFFREAFLHALRHTKTIDEYSLEAWRAILDPALTYMRDKTCRERV